MKNFFKNRTRAAKPGKLISLWANHERLIQLILLAVAILLPLIVDKRYLTTIMINCALYGTLALSLNLMTGLLGITSLGHAAFYGLGAYTAALLATKFQVNFLLTFVAGAVVAAVVALILGFPIMRVNGRQLAIITLGFCEIIRILELNWMDLTNGPLGIKGIPTFSLFGIQFKSVYSKYIVALVMLVLTYFIVSSIERSRTGRAIRAIRDNDIAAEAMGINVYYYKILIFSISAAIAGMAGAYYAQYISYIGPQLFTFDQSILILSMVILGGIGSLPGSILGAVLLSSVPELLRGFSEYRQVIYGLVIILMMVLKPNGMLGDYNMHYIRQKTGFLKKSAEVTENE